MSVASYSWRNGSGWFRIWIVLSVLWYGWSALQLYQAAHSEFDLRIAEEAYFSSAADRAAYVRQKETEAAPLCVPKTLMFRATDVRLVGTAQYLRNLDAWKSHLTYGQLVSEGGYDAIIAEMQDENNPGWRDTLVVRPNDFSFDVSTITCVSLERTTAVIRRGLIALAIPFAAVLALFAGYWILLCAFRIGGLVFRWIADGFRVDSSRFQTDSKAEAKSRFGPAFWRDMKALLLSAGAVLVVGWIVFSLSTGVGQNSTIKALTQTTVSSGIVLVILGLKRARKRATPDSL